MHPEQWIRGPFGLDADLRVSRPGLRTVLVMVPHLVAGTRLMDLVPLLEADHRVQVIFSPTGTAGCWHGTDEFVRAQGGLVAPWQQVTQHRFDLVLAAAYNDLDQVRGPVLLTAHGASKLGNKRGSRSAGPGGTAHHGLSRETLTHRGRVLPAVTVLTHPDELDVLNTSCPEAAHTGLVAGDICLDRMTASVPLRDRYRATLGLAEGQRLVTVSSTWSTDSTFGLCLGLYHRLLDELPRTDYRVAAVLHPNIWAVHGRRQVLAWLSHCMRDGLLVLPPEEGWRATMISSDLVVGDHGSTTQYAAAVGVPVLLAAHPRDQVRDGGPADILARSTPRVDHSAPLLPQLGAALAGSPDRHAGIIDLLTARPGRAAGILRKAMYQLLNLTEPVWPVPVSPVPLPRPIQPGG
ncbi:hypothetical protein F0L68_26955 [Solihabitans fulvus]|uniref:CDP-Glycerol:Poly(Glycerophosphate) glycerophosphotransferase n=1 Tax=Solihabitans fulvus TaxID=1892852 RepID=A0A5B2WYJ8_9PSEU|nr:hypothetical protein [Solihabitans fulvus]KAA2256088.1 hypothetical protein F0L68_26955 [Solihabitans fulvus]